MDVTHVRRHMIAIDSNNNTYLYKLKSGRACCEGSATRRMLSIVGERELRLHSDSHVLRCTVNNLYHIYAYTEVHANFEQ